MTSIKPAIVYWYFDADILGLAKALVPYRWDMTYPGDPGGRVANRVRPRCPIERTATDDVAWIPEAARQGWIGVTRDARILSHRAEVNAVRSSGARLLVLIGEEAGSTWGQMEIWFSRWRDIQQRLAEAGPFIDLVSRTGIRRAEWPVFRVRRGPGAGR